MIGCSKLEKLFSIRNAIFSNERSTYYAARYDNNDVVVEVAKANIDELVGANCGSTDSDNSQDTLDRCLLLKNKLLLQKVVMLFYLRHMNVIQSLGVCIRRP